VSTFELVFFSPFARGCNDRGTTAGLIEALEVPSVYWVFDGHPQVTLNDIENVASNHSPRFAPDL
jgi:hypothetical protein